MDETQDGRRIMFESWGVSFVGCTLGEVEQIVEMLKRRGVSGVFFCSVLIDAGPGSKNLIPQNLDVRTFDGSGWRC